MTLRLNKKASSTKVLVTNLTGEQSEKQKLLCRSCLGEKDAATGAGSERREQSLQRPRELSNCHKCSYVISTRNGQVRTVAKHKRKQSNNFIYHLYIFYYSQEKKELEFIENMEWKRKFVSCLEI